jgi:hypothetical protein
MAIEIEKVREYFFESPIRVILQKKLDEYNLKTKSISLEKKLNPERTIVLLKEIFFLDDMINEFLTQQMNDLSRIVQGIDIFTLEINVEHLEKKKYTFKERMKETLTEYITIIISDEEKMKNFK